jgi:choline dehydrogenase
VSRTDVLQPLRQAIVAGELSRREAVQLAIAAGVSLTAASQALSNPMSAVRVRSTSTTAAPRQTFDYIIVGSGTAGCVLAPGKVHWADCGG